MPDLNISKDWRTRCLEAELAGRDGHPMPAGASDRG